MKWFLLFLPLTACASIRQDAYYDGYAKGCQIASQYSNIDNALGICLESYDYDLMEDLK